MAAQPNIGGAVCQSPVLSFRVSRLDSVTHLHEAIVAAIGRATDRSDRSPRVNTPLLHSTVVVGVSQTAALNTGRHLYSAGRPSRWALAHIVVVAYKCLCELAVGRPPQITVKQIFTGPQQFQEMILYWHRLLPYYGYG